MSRFSMEMIHDENNFFSLLFYMGLVTIDNTDKRRTALKIPNYAIKTMYWEYMGTQIHQTGRLQEGKTYRPKAAGSHRTAESL